MQPMSTFAPHTPPTSASAWIEQWAHLVDAGGALLDVASGNGRHARYFASRGHAVLALDRDAAALANLDGVAHVTTRQADLENASWPLAKLTVTSSSLRVAVLLLGDYSFAPEAWWRIDAEVNSAGNGYSCESCVLIDPSGAPAAVARQMVAVFG